MYTANSPLITGRLNNSIAKEGRHLASTNIIESPIHAESTKPVKRRETHRVTMLVLFSKCNPIYAPKKISRKIGEDIPEITVRYNARNSRIARITKEITSKETGKNCCGSDFSVAEKRKQYIRATS